MVKEGAGLLAVIEGNAAAAVLSAVPTGVYADCANAGVTFVLRQMDRAVIANKDWTYNEYPVVNPNRSSQRLMYSRFIRCPKTPITALWPAATGTCSMKRRTAHPLPLFCTGRWNSMVTAGRKPHFWDFPSRKM